MDLLAFKEKLPAKLVDYVLPDKEIEKGLELLEGLLRPRGPLAVHSHASSLEPVSEPLLPGEVNRLIEQHDDKPIRCPRLGDEVNFKYCRIMNDRLPCSWIAGCWKTHIDIKTFLADHYSKEELDRIFAPPKPKIESLVELMEKAKKAYKKSS